MMDVTPASSSRQWTTQSHSWHTFEPPWQAIGPGEHGSWTGSRYRGLETFRHGVRQVGVSVLVASYRVWALAAVGDNGQSLIPDRPGQTWSGHNCSVAIGSRCLLSLHSLKVHCWNVCRLWWKGRIAQGPGQDKS